MDEEFFAALEAMDDSPIERENFIRVPFPYPGGKFRSLEKLLPLIPRSDVFVEVFGGSGIVTLNRPKSKLEVFNDINSGIVSFYRCIRDKDLKDQLIDRLDLTIHSREDFIWAKETWECDITNLVETAARWYYLISYSFSRVGRNFGRALNPKMLISGYIKDKFPLFSQIHQRFQNVQVENLDWRLIFKDYDSEDTVFYCDPPYYGTTINKNYDMPKEHHIELCTRIFDLKGFVALSGYANPIYDKFPWDKKETWTVHVSATTKAVNTDTSNVTQIGKSNAEECLWVKYAY